MNFQATLAEDLLSPLSNASAKPAPAVDESIARWRSNLSNDGKNPQRAVVSVVVFGIQALLLIGVATGLAQRPAPLESKPIEVALLPDVEEKEPPPPPPKPILMQPQVSLNVITLPQIYVPPPLVQVPNAPPSAITATTTPPAPKVDPNIAIQAFQMRLLREVNRNLRYPRQARQELLEGIVLIKFTMDRRGNVSNVSVHEPSAFEVLNQEGLAVLLRASFPAPPAELKGETIDMILPVKFSLRGSGGPGGRRGGGPRNRFHDDDGPRGPHPED